MKRNEKRRAEERAELQLKADNLARQLAQGRFAVAQRRTGGEWEKLTELEREFFQELVEATDNDAIEWVVDPNSRGMRARYVTKFRGVGVVSHSNVTVDNIVVLKNAFVPLDQAISHSFDRRKRRAELAAEEERAAEANAALRRILRLPPAPATTLDTGSRIDRIVADLDTMIDP